MTYYATVKIAEMGAQYYDKDGNIAVSLSGHMWLETYDSVTNTRRSMGFAPVVHGQPHGPGMVYSTDTAEYIDVLYSGQQEISQAQYSLLNQFADDPEVFGFSKTYDGLYNSCIDFTLKALKTAGITESSYEGAILPIGNIEFLVSNNILPKFTCPIPTPSWELIVKDLVGISFSRSSPLVLDLDSTTGIQLSSINSTLAVYWDIDNDGFREASGWVAGGDGLLAIDKNGNGSIDNNSELFGNDANFTNGFAALAAYDTNKDGFITSADTQFNNLKIWIDANHNGVSEATELSTLSSLGITSIATTWTDVNINNNGNTIKQQSTFTQNGVAKTIVDAWFSYDDMNTIYSGSYTLDMRSMMLPTLRGYGTLADLHIATSINQTGTGNLFDLVKALELKNFAQIFDSTQTLKTDIRTILFKWAGVETVSATSRGGFVDGQELTFLEKITGTKFIQQGTSSNPYGPEAGYDLQQAFSIAFNNLYARLVAQTSAGDLFTGTWKYNIESDTFSGITGLDTTKLNELKTEALALTTTASRQALWENVVRMVEYSIGTNNLSAASKTALQNAITGSDASLSLSGTILPALEFHRPVGVNEDGTSGNDILNGSSSDDILDAGNGNDTVNGLAGNDNIYGGTGNDILVGGTGGDYLKGSGGNDIYKYNLGDGSDTILEAGSGTGNDNDIILFGPGITLSNLSFQRMGSNSLLITISGSTPGQIMIEEQFNYNTPVEKIQFNDGSIYTLTDKNYTGNGTSQNDRLDGISNGGAVNDTIYLYDGDDISYAGAGNDTVYGGNGNDEIYGETGDDILSGGTGTNKVSGGDGNDIYIYSGGIDTYTDTLYNAGTDEIRMASGITSSMLTYNRIGNSDLQIDVAGYGSITIKSQFDFYNTVRSIETIRFADNSAIDLLSKSYATQGTEGNDSLAGIKFGGLSNDIVYLKGGNDTFNGGVGNDIVYGGSGNNSLYGDDNNDSLYGEDGNDTIEGGIGNDLLDGGSGDDILRGGEGNDIYVYSGGIDTFADAFYNAGIDEIRMASGITSSMLSYTRINNSDLKIDVAGYGSITITSQFDDYGTTRSIETIRFADNSTIDLLSKSYTTQGTTGNDSIYGIKFGGLINDVIYANDGTDYVSAGDGNDIIYGGAGNDTIYGGNGNDILLGGLGDDYLNGENNIDTASYADATAAVTATLATTSAQNTIGAGTDTLIGIENLIGSAYNDTLTGDGNANIIEGGAGNDILNGAGGIDTVSYASATAAVTIKLATTSAQNTLGAGTDTIAAFENILGSAYNDTLTGDGNANIIEGGAGNDNLNGAGGVDTVSYASAISAVTVNLSITTAQNTIGAGTDTISAFENVLGSAYNDILTGDANPNTITGGEGNDIVQGGLGDDILVGGLGIDTLSYAGATAAITVSLGTTSAQNTVSAGNDTISEFENILGSAYNDTLTGDGNANTIDGGAGNDVLNGAGGIDTVSYASATAAVTVNLATTTAQNTVGAGTDTLTAFENILGSSYNDTLTGDGNANIIEGGFGNDTLNGAGGMDTISYASATAGIMVNLSTTTAQNTIGAGSDTLTAFENILGSIYNDALYGDANANTLDGGAGNDILEGKDGNDLLIGNTGIDTASYASSTIGVTVSLLLTTAPGHCWGRNRYFI